MTAALSPPAEMVPAHALSLRMTESLAYFVNGDTRHGDHISPTYGSPSAADRAEAARLLPAFERQCAAVDGKTIQQWFAQIAVAVINPPSPHDMAIRVATIATTCSDLPIGVWTSATCKEATGRFKFLPVAAEVRDLLLPHAQSLLRRFTGLRRIAEGNDECRPTQRQAPTDAEREAVAKMVRQLVAERSHQHDAPERAKVAPSRLSDGDLMAIYERAAAAGDSAAAFRVEMLRQKIQKEAAGRSAE